MSNICKTAITVTISPEDKMNFVSKKMDPLLYVLRSNVLHLTKPHNSELLPRMFGRSPQPHVQHVTSKQ